MRLGQEAHSWSLQQRGDQKIKKKVLRTGKGAYFSLRSFWMKAFSKIFMA
jgi:hypothetical protein